MNELVLCAFYIVLYSNIYIALLTAYNLTEAHTYLAIE